MVDQTPPIFPKGIARGLGEKKDPLDLIKERLLDAKEGHALAMGRKQVLSVTLEGLRRGSCQVADRLPELNPIFIDILQKDTDQENRGYAALILGYTAPKEMIPELLSMIKAELDPKVKGDLLSALGTLGKRFGGEEIQNLLMEIAKDKSNPVEIRNRAISSLKSFPDQKTLACVSEIDQEKTPGLRAFMTKDAIERELAKQKT